MAIIQNGSSLFTGDAGSGASEIRRYVIEGDLVEAIIQLPTDLFYNTGISTYIWVITKGKPMHRSGKVQLIDASKCFVKRRKNIGSKRVDLDDGCIDLILRAYEGFTDETYEENGLVVESKVFDNRFFGFTKVTVETAQTDADGKPILKKDKRQPVKGASDTEIIPPCRKIGMPIWRRTSCPITRWPTLTRQRIRLATKCLLPASSTNSPRPHPRRPSLRRLRHWKRRKQF